MPYSTLGSDAFSPTQCNQYFEHTKIPSDQRGAALFQREVVAVRPHYAPKYLCLIFFSCIIPGKMDIDASAGQMSIESQKRNKLVGPYKNVTHIRHILEIF